MPEYETSPIPEGPINGQRNDEAMAPELAEPPAGQLTEAEKEGQWPGIEAYRERLERLQTRIRSLEAAAKRLDDKIGDLQGTDQDAALQRVEEEQTAMLLEAKNLRLVRIALIEAVPSEHLKESNQVRSELGLTIDDPAPES